jgi:amino acid permease
MDDYFGLAFGKARPENNSLQTIMLLVNTSIGSGILNQPYVFKQAGIGAACLLYPVGALVTWAGKTACKPANLTL